MVSAIDIALTGLAGATKKVGQAATNIANATTPGYETPEGDTVELSEEAVKMMLAKTEFKANVGVLQTVRDMDETLLSILDEKA